MMFQTLYFIMFLISCSYLAILLFVFKKHVYAKYMLLAVSTMAINLGYWQLSMAKSVETAIVINQVIYIGAIGTGYMMVECIAELCKRKVSRILRLISVVTGLVTLWGVFTYGKNEYYYKSLSIKTIYGCTYIDKEYGPLHVIYPVFILMLMIYGMYIVVSSLLERRKVSYITSVGCLIAMLITIFTYFGERIFHLEIELLPISYVISYLGVLILLTRVTLYDVKGIARRAMDESLEYGAVICDNKGRFAEADTVAREWFPEINELNIDYVIKDYSTDFLKQIKLWLEDEKVDSKSYIERDGRIIELKHTLLNGVGKKLHCITMRDDTKQQKYLQLIEHYNENLENEIDEKSKTVRSMQGDILISMASIVENRDNNTGGHIKRTSDVVKIFVKHLNDINYNGDFCKSYGKKVTRAASLHDFGKIAIPDVILNKPGRFTDEEYEIMKEHSAKGAAIVEQILQSVEDLEFKEIAINVAHYHHERWDGHGYPTGLRGLDIPLEARIMSLADVFDALVSKRVYKEQMDYDTAFGIIEQSNGIQFDPKLCKEFMKCRGALEELYNSYTD